MFAAFDRQVSRLNAPRHIVYICSPEGSTLEPVDLYLAEVGHEGEAFEGDL